MSGKKAQELAEIACGELRIDYSIDPSHSGKVDAHNIAIIADTIQEGMRLCKEECEAVAKVNHSLKPKESYGAMVCARRISALMGDQ